MKKQILCCSLSLLILNSPVYGMQGETTSKLLGYLKSGTGLLRANAGPMAKWAIKRAAVSGALLYATDRYLLGEPSHDTMQLVRTVQHQMGMDDWNIRIRRTPLLPFLKAYSVSLPFANTIILNEGWLNSLPIEERRFVIGHELARLKHRHTYKKIAASVAISQLLSCATRAAINSDTRMARFARNKLSRLGHGLGHCAYSRSLEYSADTTAARALGTAGGIANLNRMRQNPSIIQPLIDFKRRLGFSTHPSHEARIANLQQLQQQ